MLYIFYMFDNLRYLFHWALFVSHMSLILTSMLGGCTAKVGTQCDPVQAKTIVYNLGSGLPAYEGQAYMISTCGRGNFCHSEGIAPGLRHGAPGGLNFDLDHATTLETTDALPNSAEHRRLKANVDATLRYKDDIFGQVKSGAMPPPLPVSSIVADGLPNDWARENGDALPSIRTAEAQEKLRNWLACGAPVVEAPSPAGSMVSLMGIVGGIEPSKDFDLSPTWSDIYARIENTCLGCHGSEPFAANLDLSTSDIAYDRFTQDGPRTGSACFARGAYVVPGDPNASLLYHKLKGEDAAGQPVCGSDVEFGPMPPPFGASAKFSEAVRQWIMAGAQKN